MVEYIKCDRLVNNKTKECRYYASDLNKYIKEECSPYMAVGNIDAWQYKIMNDKHYIRYIESKHGNEPLTKYQSNVFTITKLALKDTINITFEFYIIEGNYPYDNVIIRSLPTDEMKTLDSYQFKKFLNFEIMWENI